MVEYCNRCEHHLSKNLNKRCYVIRRRLLDNVLVIRPVHIKCASTYPEFFRSVKQAEIELLKRSL